MNDKRASHETSFPTSAFSNGIWQSNRRDNLKVQPCGTNKAVGGGWEGAERLKQSGLSSNSARKELSLMMPNLKTTSFSLSTSDDRISPRQGDNNATIQTGSLSAHSRSNNNSAVLTPSSLTNSSDHFSQQADGTYMSKTQQSVAGSGEHFHDPGNMWNAAKEFRPYIAAHQGRVTHMNSVELSPPFSPSEPSRHPSHRPTTLKAIWGRNNEAANYDPLQNWDDFPPVLYNAQPFMPDATNDRRRGYKQESSTSRGPVNELTENVDILKPHDPNRFHQNQPLTKLSRPLTKSVEPSNQTTGQSFKHWEPSHQSSWTQNNCAEGFNVQLPIPDFVPCTDRHYRVPPNRLGNNYTKNRNVSQNNTLAGDIPPSCALQFDPRSRSYSNNYFAQDRQSCTAQSYTNAFYTTTVPNFLDFRPSQSFEPTIDTPFPIGDQLSERQNDVNRIYRSPLLEDFRINKAKKYELKDIYDHIVEFSGDQIGSRFIQQKLEVANSEEKDRVFSEIAQDSRQLMTDVFGNYVIQKMFEHGNQSQKKLLASHMKGHIFALSTQTYGCRVVQKALEHILTDQQASLIKELDGCVLKVVENQNGNHVIQKAIERIPGEHIQFIIDAHRGHVHYLSKHSYGCRVIQRMLEHCTPRAKRQILDELHMNIGDLIQDPFGNYVVQHVIANGEHQDRKPVIDKVQANLLENAMHKFASNVVEKALDYAEDDQCRAMLRKLTSRDEHGQSQVMKLLGHQYGNYVVRKWYSDITRSSIC